MPRAFRIVGEFWFHLVDLTLWRGPDYIQVTPKAAAIFKHLIENAGDISTHEQLLEAVWPNVHVQPEVLKVHIFELRRALADDPKHPRYIDTVPRRGYRLIAPVRDVQPPQSEGVATMASRPALHSLIN